MYQLYGAGWNPALPPWAIYFSILTAFILYGAAIVCLIKFIYGEFEGDETVALILASLLGSLPLISTFVGIAGIVVGLGWLVPELRNKNVSRINENKRQQQLQKEKEQSLNADYEEVVKMINGEVVPEWADYDKGVIGIQGSFPNQTINSTFYDRQLHMDVIRLLRDEYNRKTSN